MTEFYKKTKEQILNELNTNMDGLTTEKVRELHKLNGKNELIEKNKKN